MKNFFTLLMMSCLFLSAKSETHIVTISSFQFSPSNLNVVLGDVIRWEWSEGFHNTESVTIPGGAATWSSAIEDAGFFFEYTVTVAGTYQYQCAPHAGFMTGMFTASGVLPVQMTNFNVQSRNNGAFLSWNTQTESNSDFFAIRRSYDGESFAEIGRVPAAGHSTQTRTYSYLDNDVRRNTRYVYYEIGITDKDGSVQLSPIKLLKNNDAVKKMIISISPNPVAAAGHLIIQFNSDEKSILLARISDMTGKIVLTTNLAAVPGVNNGHIHLGELAAGNYMVQFSFNGKTESYKIAKR